MRRKRGAPEQRGCIERELREKRGDDQSSEEGYQVLCNSREDAQQCADIDEFNESVCLRTFFEYS